MGLNSSYSVHLFLLTVREDRGKQYMCDSIFLKVCLDVYRKK